MSIYSLAGFQSMEASEYGTALHGQLHVLHAFSLRGEFKMVAKKTGYRNFRPISEKKWKMKGEL